MRAVYDAEAPRPESEPEYEGFEISRYHDMWREAVDDYTEARAQHYRDEQYYDGDVKGTGEGHWTAAALQKLAARNQPPSVFNFIENLINAIAGVEQRARSEPRALPRTPKDQKSAEIVTDALRYIKEQTRWEFIKADAFLDALKIGFAAVEIGGAEDSVPITPIDWKEFFFDPRSRRPDFSDARYLGVAKWLDKDVALATYVPPDPGPYEPEPYEALPMPQIPPQPIDPMMAQQWAAMAQQGLARYQQAEEQNQLQYQIMEQQRRAQYDMLVKKREEITLVIENTASGSGSTGTLNETDFEDRPKDHFCDAKRKRVFVIDMWHQDPKKGWMRCVFTGAGKLFTEEAKFVEKDQWGREVKTHPIQAFSIHVSGGLWRYGAVRNMRSPQDEVNKRHSKSMHLLTMNRVKTTAQAMEQAGGKETLRQEATRPDGVIVVQNLDEIEIDTNIELAAGQQRQLEFAVQFLERMGPNPQLRGEQGRATSGRAVLALQQAGLGALGPIYDRLHEWELRCYRSKWYRAQQFWTGPMYVRVTDDKNAARFAAVNGAPVIQEQNGNKPPQDRGGMGNQPQPMQPGQMPEGMDPRMMMGANGGLPMTPEDMGETGPALAELDMDIIIDRAPEAATLQAEQFEHMSNLAQAGVLGPPGNPDVSRLLITSSSLPNKTELLDLLDKMAEGANQPNPAQMAELKKLEAMIEKLIAETKKTEVETVKIAAEIPGAQADAALTAAKVQTEHANARATDIGAQATSYEMLSAPIGGSPSIDPLAAAAPTGGPGPVFPQ